MMNIISINNYILTLPTGETLLDSVNIQIHEGEKVALVGANGVGKSTLLHAIMQEQESELIRVAHRPYLVPQQTEQYNEWSIAQVIGVDAKIEALNKIEAGEVDHSYFNIVGEDWDIEERAKNALSEWGLESMEINTPMKNLSGGEKTKVFLTGITLYQPKVVLLDEPSNHLDRDAREKLYSWIEHSNQTIVVVSHDRELLNLLTDIYELSPNGVNYYAGNYDDYKEQKEIEHNAFLRQLSSQRGELRRAKRVEREMVERRDRITSRGAQQTAKKSLPKIIANARSSGAQRTTHQIKERHQNKISKLSEAVQQLQQKNSSGASLKLELKDSSLHYGKTFAEAVGVNFGYNDEQLLWEEQGLEFVINSGERIEIRGANGSGKSTFIKLLTGELKPKKGELRLAEFDYLYLDQNYSLLNDSFSVYEQAQSYNINMEQHEVKMHLARSQFFEDSWDKPCGILSGGEKMKLSLCMLIISERTPDILMLDEPTNNLDLDSLMMLSKAVQEYKGTLLVISHDRHFIDDVGVERVIEICGA